MNAKSLIGPNRPAPEAPGALRRNNRFTRKAPLLVSTWVAALTLAFSFEGSSQNFACPNPVDCLLPSEALACWLQRPDTSTNGFDVLATWGTNSPCTNSPQTDSPIMADDFVACCTFMPDIYIWGSWLQDRFDSNATMIVSIWEDQPATNDLPSQPLSAIGPVWSGYFGPSINPALPCLPYISPYQWCLAATNLYEQFLDPTTTNVLGFDTNLYCYKFSIPTNAQPLLNPGAVYWLSVSALPKSLTNLFGWKCCITNDHHLDDAVFTNMAYSVSGTNAPWIDLHYPPGHPFASNTMDLSFALASEEVDYFPHSLVTVEYVLEAPGATPLVALLEGPATVVVGVGPNGQTCLTTNGFDAALTEMVQLDVIGPSALGALHVSLQCPQDCGNQRSLGLIYEATNLIPGKLEVPPFASGLANSFFDIWHTVKLITNSITLEWCPTQPVHMSSVINNKPPGVAGGIVGGIGVGGGGLGGSPTLHFNRYNALQLVEMLPKLFGSKLLILLALHDPQPYTNNIPTITMDPKSVYAPTLGNAQFRVTAAVVRNTGAVLTGTSLSYQWYQSPPTSGSFTPISRATNQTYTVPQSEVSPSFSGSAFEVVVKYSGSSVSVTSAPAYLNVEGPLEDPTALQASVQYDPFAGVLVTFPVEVFHSYSVVSADDLSWTYWPPAYSIVPFATYSGPVTIPIAPAATQQFYRIVTPAVDP